MMPFANEHAARIIDPGKSEEMEYDGMIKILQHRLLKKEVKADKTLQEIQVFPRGEVYIEKYDETVDCNDVFFKKMVKAFNEPSLSKPFIDVNHEFREAYGTIEGLEAKEKGLFAKIKLNDKGIEAIKNNEYRYISPAFGNVTDNQGQRHENVLIAVTLTNIPALQGTLPTLQDQIKLSGKTDFILMEFVKPQRGGKMLKLANHFGLNSEASEEKILEAAIAEKKTLTQERDKAVKNLEKVTEEKEIAVKELETANNKLKDIELEANEKEKKTYFKKAAEEGRVEIKELEKWQNQWDKDKEFVISILDSRPVQKDKQKTTINHDNAKLEDEDRKIMLSAGFDPDKPEDVKKYRREVLDEEV